MDPSTGHDANDTNDGGKYQGSRGKPNFLSSWVDPLLWLGFKRTLTQNDLYAHPPETDSEKLLEDFNSHWKKELSKGSNSLVLALVRCLFWPIVFQGLLAVSKVALLVGQSVIIGYLTDYFSVPNPTVEEDRDAYLLAFGLVACSLAVLLLHAHQYLAAYKIGMMARTTMTAAIYQKVFSLSQVTIGRLSIGHIINLTTNDVQRFENAFLHPHIIWMAPIHLAVTLYLIYLELGWSSFVIMAFILFQIPMQISLAKLFSRYRFKSAVLTDKRVRIMNEIITGIRVIKMYAWEYAFKRIVDTLRRLESRLILKGGIVRASNLAFMMMSASLMAFVVFCVYTATGGDLTPKKVFTTLSLIYVLRLVTIHHLILNVVGFSEAHVALTRIKRFLSFKEATNICGMEEKKTSGPSITVRNLTAAWDSNDAKDVLKNISFDIDNSQSQSLLSIVGPVGAGKSTLLQCLLGELIPKERSINIRGTISYAAQEPWLFSETLRENILFGKPYNAEWYNTVVKACALSKDIQQLAQGDLTLVGERGVTLSGGQKARVSLARAVYHRADIYLLDDPLSAVDAAVAKHLYKECIRGLLKNCVVLLVTHQVQFAVKSDRILVLNEGVVEVCSSNEELRKRGIDTRELLGLLAADDKAGPSRGNPPNELYSLSNSTSMTSLQSTSTHATEAQEDVTSMLLTPEETSHGSLSLKTYVHYFRAGGSILAILIMMLLFAIGEGSVVVSDWWLSNWAQCTSENRSVLVYDNWTTCSLDDDQRRGVYGALIVSLIGFNLLRAVMCYAICVNASRVLHNRMFASVMRVPVLFFDTNPIGRILNRFSKDIGYLDDLLPYIFCEYLLWLFRSLSTLVTSVAAIPWLIVPCALMLGFFFLLRYYYICSAREVKRLEAIARSPLYSHISSTLQGLLTIKTFKKEDLAMRSFHSYQNSHTQGYYLYHVLTRWLGLRADIVSTAFLALFAFSAVGLSREFDPTLLGLALVYSLVLNNVLQYVIRQSAEVENIMISAERILGYTKLKSEASFESPPSFKDTVSAWPKRAQISMKNVSFQYSPELPLVLKDLDLTIQPGEKVGIVGRTGAGKSSLLSVLYRLAEPSGVITIDGVDIQSIGLHDLRNKMSIIPQDPVLFSGTMRYNLDPFNEFSDNELWDVLEQVQLKGAVEQLEGQLAGEVSEGGSNFSAGQKQLVCLARALLKKNKILILDEATANVDLKTDEIIQDTLHSNFAECTVITIAHRINTVIDSDKILVLESGEVKEFGRPRDLLQDKTSLFSEMVEATGRATSIKLCQLAMEDKIDEPIVYCSSL
ncbi:ATP-binding cassette sub-family C member 4-like isoform X2 [Halichondria panicea]|uniref:ATP-binding cassette sub-family C member 4-like isoform X2 n=1 Tax=Halichondria panicea TaxID=6063 RepID=UPI00312B6882